MAVINRIRVGWSGFIGGPGVNTFYATDASAALSTLADFYAVVAGWIPPTVTLQIESSGDSINDTNGALVSTWVGAAQPAIVGTAAFPYSAASGAVVNWLTNAVVVGSNPQRPARLRGRTFLVPLSSNAYEPNGTIATDALASIRTAAAAVALAAASTLVVWHRPGIVPAVNVGSSSPIVSSLVKDKVAILRSRRD